MGRRIGARWNPEGTPGDCAKSGFPPVALDPLPPAAGAVVAVCHRLVPATTRRSCVVDVWRDALEPKQTTTSTDLQALQETGATGLEPATSGVTGRRSNQLNYAPKRSEPV
jgi:hypothetical protein